MINVNVFAEELIYLHILAKRFSASSNGAWILNLCLVFCFAWKSSNTTVSRGSFCLSLVTLTALKLFC